GSAQHIPSPITGGSAARSRLSSEVFSRVAAPRGWNGSLLRLAAAAAATLASPLSLSLCWWLKADCRETDCERLLGQLHPLSASQSFTHFQSHCGVRSFQFAARLNDAIDLRKHSVPVNSLGFEQPRELSFFFIEQVCLGREVYAMIFERSLDFRFLIVGQAQSRHQSRVRPPCSAIKSDPLLKVRLRDQPLYLRLRLWRQYPCSLLRSGNVIHKKYGQKNKQTFICFH